MDACNLMDLGFVGPAFTWCNNQQGRLPLWVRLDREFCSESRRLKFTGGPCEASCKGRVRPLPTCLGEIDDVWSRKRPFKFEKLWLNKTRIDELVPLSWCKNDRGSPMYYISRKLKRLEEDLRSWSKEIVGDIHEKVSKLEDTVEESQLKEAIIGLIEEEDIRLRKDSTNLHNAIKDVEVFWRSFE